MVPVLIINLERDVARRDALTARLDALNVPYRIHKATAGKDLSTEELVRHSPKRELMFPRELLPNEIATSLSHVGAVQMGLDLGTEFFCVLEDDVIPDPRFPECLDETVLKALPAFEALRLFAHFDRWDKSSKTVAALAGSAVVRMLRPGWGCAGQIYTRAGAQKIVSSMRYIAAPIDFAIYHDCHVMGLKVLETRPPLITHAPVPSSVGFREVPVPPVSRPVRNMIRVSRKVRAARSFVQAWGLREFISFFPTLR